LDFLNPYVANDEAVRASLANHLGSFQPENMAIGGVPAPPSGADLQASPMEDQLAEKLLPLFQAFNPRDAGRGYLDAEQVRKRNIQYQCQRHADHAGMAHHEDVLTGMAVEDVVPA
jgi:hypothetical protein